MDIFVIMSGTFRIIPLKFSPPPPEQKQKWSHQRKDTNIFKVFDKYFENVFQNLDQFI